MLGGRETQAQKGLGKHGKEDMSPRTESITDRNNLRFKETLRVKEKGFFLLFGMRKLSEMLWTCRLSR